MVDINEASGEKEMSISFEETASTLLSRVSADVM